MLFSALFCSFTQTIVGLCQHCFLNQHSLHACSQIMIYCGISSQWLNLLVLRYICWGSCISRRRLLGVVQYCLCCKPVWFKLQLPLFVWFRNDLTQIWDFCYDFVVFFKIRRRLLLRRRLSDRFRVRWLGVGFIDVATASSLSDFTKLLRHYLIFDFLLSQCKTILHSQCIFI
jgi:hypothetical protein